MSHQWSSDGSYWWDGAAWRPASPDRRYFYDGASWQPLPVAPEPAPGALAVEVPAPTVPPPPTPTYSYQPAPTPGLTPGAYAPAPGTPVPPMLPVTYQAAGFSFTQQFGGAAAWSIGLGLVSIVVPLFANFYFPILPIIGFINAVRAIQRGRLIGGIVGIVVNALGGLVSLFASGLLG
jgi:uncharacterized membrane protein